jgi:hypothetical protein
MPRVQVREMFWGEDGWPLPGLPLEHLAATTLITQKSLSGTWAHQADFGNVDEIKFLPKGEFKSGDRSGKWKLSKDQLTLMWPKRETPGEFWEDKVTLHYQGNYYVGRTQSGLVVRGYRLGS